MNLNKTLLLSTILLSISQLSFAQDLSAWSDKTVCRLLNTQNVIEPYMIEANRRGLTCKEDKKVKRPDNTTFRTAHKNIDFTNIKKSINEDDDGLFTLLEINPLVANHAKAPIAAIDEAIVGSTAIAFQLNDGECGVEEGKWSDCDNDRERTELNFKKEKAKQEKWYRFHIKFTDSHNNIAPASLSLMQWKRYSKPSRTMIQFQQTSAGLVLNRNGETFRDANIMLVHEKDLYNRWIEIIFNTNWHPDENKGFMKVWVDGQLKFDHKGPSHADTADVSMRVGIYSAFLGRYRALYPDTPIPTREVIYDGIRASRTCMKLLENSEKCESLNAQKALWYQIHNFNRQSDKASSKDIHGMFAVDFK